MIGRKAMKYPAAGYGDFTPRGSRQISVQARLPGLLYTGIKRTIGNDKS